MSAKNLFVLSGKVVLDASGVESDLDGVKTKAEEVKSSISNWQETGKKMQKVGGIMTAAVSVPLGIIGKKAIEAGNTYEGQMNRVKAISGAVGDELTMLDERAKDLGKSSVFSASEAAGAMEMMASAGFEALEIYDALPGVIDLAAVSGGDMSLASQSVAAAVNQFKLEAEDATHVADVFAKASAETNAQIGDMSEAMKNAGPMASSLGVSLEETAAMIGLMANENIKGSLAGTTLKNAMLQLTGAGDEAKEILNGLGVEVFNSNGEMNSMADIISDLRGGMNGMTDEQRQHTVATIFGRQAIGGMMALINSAPGELEAMTEGLVNSDEAASNMADTMNEGVPGALASMRSSFEGAQIAIQEALAPIIIAVAKIVTKLTDLFIEMPSWVQTFIVLIGAILLAVGPLLLAIGTFIKYLSIVKVALAALSAPMLLAAGKFILITAGIVAVIEVIRRLVGWIGDLGITWEDIGDLIVGVANLIFDLVTAPIRATYELFSWLANGILDLFSFDFEFPSVMDAAKNAWEGVKDFFSWSLDGIKSLFSFDWLTGNTPSSQGRGRNAGKESKSVSWNAEGGVFKRPTIFDTSSAGLQGVGEAGAEAIIPLSPNVLAGIGRGIDEQSNNGRVEGLLASMEKEFKGLRKELGDMKIEMDGRTVGGIVSPYVDDNLGKQRHFANNRF